MYWFNRGQYVLRVSVCVFCLKRSYIQAIYGTVIPISVL